MADHVHDDDYELFDPEAELKRVASRPSAESMPQYLNAFGMDLPPNLSYVTVSPSIPAPMYASRIRSALAACLEALISGRLQDETVLASIPHWLHDGTHGDPESPDRVSAKGRALYKEHTHRGEWRLNDWLSRLDPDLDVRGWEWWDITQPADMDTLHVWIDSRGEPSFSHLDLLWLCYSSGAVLVSEPRLTETSIWLNEPTVENE